MGKTSFYDLSSCPLYDYVYDYQYVFTMSCDVLRLRYPNQASPRLSLSFNNYSLSLFLFYIVAKIFYSEAWNVYLCAPLAYTDMVQGYENVYIL